MRDWKDVVVERLHDPALGEQVVPVGDGGGELHVLLDEEHGDALVLDLADDVADLLDDHRGQALGRLVEQQQPRARAQHAGDREHLLLAAGQLGAGEVAALVQHRELLVDLLEAPRVGLARDRREQQVLLRPRGWRRCRGRRAPSRCRPWPACRR